MIRSTRKGNRDGKSTLIIRFKFSVCCAEIRRCVFARAGMTDNVRTHNQNGEAVKEGNMKYLEHFAKLEE